MENKYIFKSGICYLQITTLVIALFAFSYIFSENYGSIKEQLEEVKELEKQNNELKKETSIAEFVLKKILDKLRKPLIQSVSAQTTDYFHCCEEDSNEAICQEYPIIAIESICESDKIFPGNCDEFSTCQLGCCYNAEDGICAAKSPKLKCEVDGGIWSNDENCNNAECRNGCCVLGSQAVFTTEQRCESLAGLYGLPKDFKSEIPNEPACILLTETDFEGACLVGGEDFIEEQGCVFTSKSQCMNWTDDDITKFHKDYLCSHTILNTICESQNYTGCVEGKDGVYWFDSCGNQENIYDSNKARSWNNGMVLTLEDSCSANENNANNPDCGNCQHFFGSICRQYDDDIDLTEPSEGEYICRDLDCHNVEIDGEIVTQKNGEGWCEYDGAIGVDETQTNPVARDTPGSRHWRKVCYMGEVRTEPCSDFRNGLCIQQNIDLGNKDVFSSSACRVNRWQECIGYNLEEDREGGMEKCDRHPDCWVNEVRVDKDFSFDSCVPRYPEGFDLTDSRSANSGEQICSLASQKCVKVEEKKIDGDWECIAGCDCDTIKMANEMHALCVSLGDCGASVNYIGEFTEGGYSIVNAPKLSQTEINRYKSFKDVIKGLYAVPGDMSILLKGFLHPQDLQSGLAGEFEDMADDQEALSTATTVISGGAGVASMVSSALSATESTIYVSSIGSQPVAPYPVTVVSPNPSMAAFGNFLGGFGVGMAVSGIMAMIYGLEGDAALAMTVVGVIGGTIIGIAAIGAGAAAAAAGEVFSLLAFCLTPGTCMVVVIIIILIATFFAFAGIGKIREKTITFDCKSWKQPYGGDDCEKCIEDASKPCTPYRCQSLGMGCGFIGQGTGNELCIHLDPHDVSSPVISSLEGIQTQGISYEEESNAGFKLKYNGGCLPPFSSIAFGIKTNELALCKMDQIHTNGFEEMQEYFGGQSLLAENHPMSFALPSPESVIEEYGLTSEPNEQGMTSEFILEKFGNLNYFVRCKDAQGNENEAEFVINFCVDNSPDLTPPLVSSVNPSTGSSVAKNTQNKNITVWVNEPATCKWSRQNTGYNFMENEMLCSNSLINQESNGFPCKTYLTGLQGGENKFYIRCQDTSNQTNAMQESYVYVINVAEAELGLNIVSPANNEIFYTSNVFTSVELKVETSEGIENGKARCDYSFNDANHIMMQSTYAKLHRQMFSTMMNGEYTIFVRCEDIAGNLVNDSVSFSVDVDITPPAIVRAYFSNNQLKIITSENADCKYANNPGVNFEDKEEMFDIEKQHTAPWEQGMMYYVECADNFGNHAEINLEAYQIVGV